MTIRYETGSHAERTEYQKRPRKYAPDLVLRIESKKQKGRLSALKEKKGTSGFCVFCFESLVTLVSSSKIQKLIEFALFQWGRYHTIGIRFGFQAFYGSHQI